MSDENDVALNALGKVFDLLEEQILPQLEKIEARQIQRVDASTKRNERIQAALAKLPTPYFLKMGTELDEDGDLHMTACLFEEPPDGGWPTRGARFNHGPEYADYSMPCPENMRYEPNVHVGISAEPGDDRFWTLLADMLEGQLERLTKKRA